MILEPVLPLSPPTTISSLPPPSSASSTHRVSFVNVSEREERDGSEIRQSEREREKERGQRRSAAIRFHTEGTSSSGSCLTT